MGIVQKLPAFLKPLPLSKHDTARRPEGLTLDELTARCRINRRLQFEVFAQDRDRAFSATGGYPYRPRHAAVVHTVVQDRTRRGGE